MRLRVLCAFACCVALHGLLPGCGRAGSIADVDLLVSVSIGTTSVATGEGFPLTVTRIWRKDIEPSPWDDGVLSPLVVRAQETRRREDRLRVEEIRTFRAYAFALRDVSIPSVLFVGRSIGGSGRILARSEPLSLHVTPTLDPKAPGASEFPDVPQPIRPTWPGSVLAVSLLLGLAVYALRRRRVRASLAALTAPVPADPQARALAWLARLGAEGGEPAAVVSEVAQVLRCFVGDQRVVAVAQKTSEEVVALLPAAVRIPLRDLLAACDQVKFAAHRPTSAASAQLQAGAADFVRTCGSEQA